MRYVRLFADDNGESHFDGHRNRVHGHRLRAISRAARFFRRRFPASQVAFMRAPAGWTSDFHVSSARNMFVVLSGEWEVTASDGEARRFATGSALLVEDTTGKGHSSRVTSKTESVSLVVALT